MVSCGCFSQQQRNLLAAFMALELDDRFASVIVDGSNARVFVWLPRSRDHDLLAFRTPQSMEGGEPTEIELIRIVEHVAGF